MSPIAALIFDSADLVALLDARRANTPGTSSGERVRSRVSAPEPVTGVISTSDPILVPAADS